MDDLAAALRAKLDAGTALPLEGRQYRRALLAVLDNHGLADSPFSRNCKTCGAYFEYGVLWPCPTIRGVAAALGIEADRG